MKLKPKHQLFADYYIESLNAADAARKAGYSEKTARIQGSTLLTNPNIKQYIDERIEKRKSDAIWNADQVLEFLTKVAKGELTESIPVGAGGGLQVLTDNLPQMKDRVKAAELLGKRHALFTDKQSVTGDVELSVKIVDDIE